MISYQIKTNPTVYDAFVVGSGAGGGMTGYVLAHAGLNVSMLEAGPFFGPAKDAMQLRWPWESPRRGAGTVDRKNTHLNSSPSCAAPIPSSSFQNTLNPIPGFL